MASASEPPKYRRPDVDKKADYLQRKLAMLDVIEKLKDILFAPCNAGVTQQVKEQAWGEVLEQAKLLRLASSRKTWTYARDDLYNVWKGRTMKKIAAVRKTGVQVSVAASIKKKLDEVDFKILDIICKVQQADCPGHSDSEDESENHEPPSKVWRRVSERKLIAAVGKNFRLKRQALSLSLLRHEIYIRKLMAFKLEKEILKEKSSTPDEDTTNEAEPGDNNAQN